MVGMKAISISKSIRNKKIVILWTSSKNSYRSGCIFSEVNFLKSHIWENTRVLWREIGHCTVFGTRISDQISNVTPHTQNTAAGILSMSPRVLN